MCSRRHYNSDEQEEEWLEENNNVSRVMRSIVELAVRPRQPGSKVPEAYCCDDHDSRVRLLCHVI